MKRLIVLITMIVMLSPTAALAVDGELTFGFVTDSNQYFTAQPAGRGKQVKFVSNLELGHRIDFASKWIDAFRPYVALVTYMDETVSYWRFHPASVDYKIGARITKHLPGNKLSLFVDLKHSCWHPVDTRGPVVQYDLIELGIKF